ncbi:MAG: tRNA lysidine(34) synthetase TilS [Rhizobacter sp.]|nr:tRNA lysidine(34) synthetase TilS [Ferruginibacter sp.]
MNLLVASFKNFISANHLFNKKDHLLIAVSGGADSVVLCELCSQSGYTFSIAHCNFQLRNEESNEDENFVKAIAEKYQAPFFVQKFDTQKYAADHKLSIQVTARELRYGWFEEILNLTVNDVLNSPLGGRGGYVLTAHHADDNLETITMNFFKGSGINGLKGILPKNNNIVRPLLFATKASILSFATENNLPYREDSSNSSDKYTRNYFRNQLLPAVEKVFPQVKENLLHNAERFKEINTIYQSAIEKITSKLVFTKGAERHIPVLKLQFTEAMPTVLYEIIKDYGFTSHQTGEVIKLLSSESGKYVQSSTHRILRNRKWLIVAALNDTSVTHYLIEQNEKEVNFEAGKIIVQQTGIPAVINTNALTAQLDSKNIQFPLLLRKWKTGDYFYPLGMTKKKKISRFLIDLKLSLLQKQEVWVVESNKKIIWVVGYRIDDRFKISGQVQDILTLCLVPAGQTS